ncbi:MAG: ATP synthase F0 subunit B [Desulfatiglandales bacterium]
MLQPDYTLFIQIANFLFLVFVLNILLYKPIRNMLRRRQEQMHSFEDTRNNFLLKSGRYERELEENVKSARVTGVKAKGDLKNEGLDVEKGMLQDAASATGERIEKAKMEIEQSMDIARQSLQNELSVFSRELAEKVLGRSI